MITKLPNLADEFRGLTPKVTPAGGMPGIADALVAPFPHNVVVDLFPSGAGEPGEEEPNEEEPNEEEPNEEEGED